MGIPAVDSRQRHDDARHLAARHARRAARLAGAGLVAVLLLPAVAAAQVPPAEPPPGWSVQLVTAAGLSSSCLAAALSAIAAIPAWCWILWILCAAHAVAGILVVRARLEVRIAARSRKADEPVFFKPARFAQIVLIVSGLAMLLIGSPWISVALILPSLLYLWELGGLASTIDTPLRTVGLRAMSVSIGFSIFAICGLWPG